MILFIISVSQEVMEHFSARMIALPKGFSIIFELFHWLVSAPIIFFYLKCMHLVSYQEGQISQRVKSIIESSSISIIPVFTVSSFCTSNPFSNNSTNFITIIIFKKNNSTNFKFCDFYFIFLFFSDFLNLCYIRCF